jgi:putative lipoprotein
MGARQCRRYRSEEKEKTANLRGEEESFSEAEIEREREVECGKRPQVRRSETRSRPLEMNLLLGAYFAVNLVYAQMADVRGAHTSHLLPRTHNLVQFAVACPSQGKVIPDSWFAIDKVKHFFMSAFIESVSYSALQAAHANYRPALAGAIGITAAFGLGKEIHDYRNPKNHFSIKDLSWDAIGAGAGVVLLSHTIR